MEDAISPAFRPKSVFKHDVIYFSIDIPHLVMKVFQNGDKALIVTTWCNVMSYIFRFAVVATALFVFVDKSAGTDHHANIVEDFLHFLTSGSVVG